MVKCLFAWSGGIHWLVLVLVASSFMAINYIFLIDFVWYIMYPKPNPKVPTSLGLALNGGVATLVQGPLFQGDFCPSNSCPRRQFVQGKKSDISPRRHFY